MPVSSFANSVGMAKVAVESIKEIFGSLKLTGVGGGAAVDWCVVINTVRICCRRGQRTRR